LNGVTGRFLQGRSTRVKEGGLMAQQREIEVARITARQAIIVAMITAVAGLAGGYFGRPAVKSSPTDSPLIEHRLRILGVSGAALGQAIRIVADVDGQGYSYPSRALWADIGPEMSQEDFLLPAGKVEYRIRFSAFVRDENGRLSEATSQEGEVIPVAATPLQRQYALHVLDAGFHRALSEPWSVKYEVR
jgi:hypothetical protein